MSKRKSNNDLDIESKGYDFPKTKIPTHLEPVEQPEKKVVGATVFDWIKNKFDILFNFVGDAKKTIDKYVSVVPQVKTIAFLLLAAMVVYLITKLI